MSQLDFGQLQQMHLYGPAVFKHNQYIYKHHSVDKNTAGLGFTLIILKFQKALTLKSYLVQDD